MSLTAYVGQSLRRREDIKFLTGNGRYVDDIKLLPASIAMLQSVMRASIDLDEPHPGALASK
jgi:CO/xanthine dehydrogenase Mo-binding subunit